MILDELVVVLGLDARQFNQAQREAMDTFRRTQQGAEQFGKAVEAQGMKLGEAFGMARKGVLGLVGAFVGGEAAAFIDHVINMDAATGRMAKTIGVSVENLGIWQGMIRQVGGSAEEATSALSAMQTEINNVRQGGGTFSEGFGYLLNKIGGAGGKNSDQITREISAYLRGEVAAGRETTSGAATYLGRVPGMNQSMINLLLGDLGKLEEAARKVGGATKETADAAAALQGKFSLMVQAFERFAAGLIPFIDLLMKPINQITKDDIAKTGAFSGGMTFDKGGVMDRLDTWLWGEYGQHGKPAGSVTPGIGSRGDRNNNPGNIEYGSFARAHGATGTDGRFAIFPDKSSGESAMADLLARNYQGMTLSQIQQKWVGTGADPTYVASMSAATGLGPNDVPNLSDPAMRARVMSGMSRGEGTSLGARGAASSRGGGGGAGNTTTSTTTIGKVEVHTQATDADGIARDLAPAIKHSMMTAPANTGLV